MLAPFEVADREVDNLVETLKEEMDTFYYGKKSSPKVAFTGVGVHEYKRRHLLYLNPVYETDLEYCCEMVSDICKSFIPRAMKYNPNKKQFLPLGIFNDTRELHLVLEQAKIEFNTNGDLHVESIGLFENKHGIWIERDVLVTFETNENNFLQINTL